MKALLLALSIVTATADAAGNPPTALEALKVLPKEDLANLARIEGPDGGPTPERWYILVHSDNSDTGAKEFVVSDGELIAARQLSQFAATLGAEDVIGRQKIQVDSDKLSKLLDRYAKANGIEYATVNYQLAKEGAESRPVWKVTCLAETGEELGTLVTSAETAKVLSHEGFAIEPGSGKRREKERQAKVQFRTQATPQVAVNQPPDETDEADDASAETDGDQPSGESEETEKVASSSRPDGGNDSRSRHQTRSRRVRPPNPVTTVRDVTRPVRRTIGRILPF